MTGVDARLVHLTARVDHAVWQLQQDQSVSTATLEVLLQDVLHLAPELAGPEGRALLGRVESLQRGLQTAHERLAGRLDGVGGGRRAVRGYTHSGASVRPPALLRTRA